MMKRGVLRTVAGKPAQPMTLRSRKRRFQGSEETAPAGDNETLQPEEHKGSSVCMLIDSGVAGCTRRLCQELKTSAFPSSEGKSQQLDCTTGPGEIAADCTSARKERGASPSFQAAGGSSVPDMALAPGGNSLVLSDTRTVLESESVKAFKASESRHQRQLGNRHVDVLSGEGCGETGRRVDGRETEEYCSAMSSHTVSCPTGSLLPGSEGREVGRGSGNTESVVCLDREKDKPTGGNSDHTIDQPCLGEEWATPDVEPLQSAVGFPSEDGAPKKKVRKRMGMLGLGERERRTHFEGQIPSRNERNGESERGKEREGREHKELHSDCRKEFAVQRSEMVILNKGANGALDLGTIELIPDMVQGLRSQSGVPPSDLCIPIPLDSVLEDEEPSQPIVEASDKIPEQSISPEKTLAPETMSSQSMIQTEKIPGGEGTSPYGTGESSEERASGVSKGENGEPCSESEGATCWAQRDASRCIGKPCMVQEANCNLNDNALLEEVPQGQGGYKIGRAQQSESSKVCGCSSFELEFSLDPKLVESETAAVACDGVMCVPLDNISVSDQNGLSVSQTSGEVKGAGVAKTSRNSLGPGEESRPEQPFGTEYVEQDSSQGCVSLSQGMRVAEDLQEEPQRDKEDAIEARSCETAQVMETKERPAPGFTDVKSSPEDCQHPSKQCVTGSVGSAGVHPNLANNTDPQRPHDQPPLGLLNMNPDLHQDRGDGVLQHTVPSHEGGGGYGLAGSEYVSVLPPVCEDESLHHEMQSVPSLGMQPTSGHILKPSDDLDTDPDPPASPCSVSDSQLNNIALCEMEDGCALDCSDQSEDASELVCGLIRELSFLNRTVMAAHRELDNIRRGNKAPKRPQWCSYRSRRSEM